MGVEINTFSFSGFSFAVNCWVVFKVVVEIAFVHCVLVNMFVVIERFIVATATTITINLNKKKLF